MRRQINDFSNYTVSTSGLLYNIKTQREFIGYKAKNGYMVVTLTRDDGRVMKMYVHRLVALTFIPIIVGKDIVNHKDGNKLNNVVPNLEWCTNVENLKHAWETGLNKPKDRQFEHSVYQKALEDSLSGKSTVAETASKLNVYKGSFTKHVKEYAVSIGKYDDYKKAQYAQIRKSVAKSKVQLYRIAKLDLTTECVLDVYESLIDARNSVGSKSSGSICNACHKLNIDGTRKQSKGFKWMKICVDSDNEYPTQSE